MKRLILALALLLQVFGSYAESPYFSTRTGERMTYVRRNASNGRLVWTYVATVDSVYSGGIDFTYDFHRAGGSQMYGGPLRLKMAVEDNGDIRVDVAATMKTFVHNLFPKMEVWSDGGETLLPASMRPGDVLPDVLARAKLIGLSYNVSFSERKVLRRESFKTPAGTFDCLVVEEHKLESGLRNREVRTLTWYSKGIGIVNHLTYDWKSGKLLTIETLESME